MDIKQKEEGTKGTFYIEIGGASLAEMTYVWVGDKKIIIDHTEVNERLRGHQAGKQLLQAAVSFAREKGIKILPLCPFAKATFDKNADLQDVL